MKLEKKHYIIIGVVVAIIAIWYFFLRKKKAESGFEGVADPFSGQECEQGENPQDFSGCVQKKTESSYRVASSAHPKCWPGTTWKDWCACCLPDNPSERTNNSPAGIKPVISQAMMSSMSPSHPKCKPGTTWNDAAAKCIPDTPENIKWPSWLRIKRACPQGLVLDPITKGCVHPYQL